jgi:hypothetical protein
MSSQDMNHDISDKSSSMDSDDLKIISNCRYLKCRAQM